jgi:hypothetical protein
VVYRCFEVRLFDVRPSLKAAYNATAAQTGLPSLPLAAIWLGKAGTPSSAASSFGAYSEASDPGRPEVANADDLRPGIPALALGFGVLLVSPHAFRTKLGSFRKNAEVLFLATRGLTASGYCRRPDWARSATRCTSTVRP